MQGKFNLLNIKKMRVIPLNSELCQKDKRLFLSEVVYLLLRQTGKVRKNVFRMSHTLKRNLSYIKEKLN